MKKSTGTKRTASAAASSKSSSADRRSSGRGLVVCLNNNGYESSLEVGKFYRTLPATASLPDGWIRVIDESGEDYGFDATRFEKVPLSARAQTAIIRARQLQHA